MRYLVTGRVKPGKEMPLLRAIENETLGKDSIADIEFLRNMENARLLENGDVRWVEVCFCPTPLMEERPHWEEFFELTNIRDAHSRKNCRDETGLEPRACYHCDCTENLETKMETRGVGFLEMLKKQKR